MPQPHLSDLFTLDVPRLINRQVRIVVRLLVIIVHFILMGERGNATLGLARGRVVASLLDDAEELVQVDFLVIGCRVV